MSIEEVKEMIEENILWYSKQFFQYNDGKHHEMVENYHGSVYALTALLENIREQEENERNF